MSDGRGDANEANETNRRGATRYRWWVLAALCSLAFLTYLDRICIMRVQGDLERDLGLATLTAADEASLRARGLENDLDARTKAGQDRATARLSWIFSAFVAGYALFEVPGGWLGDRWGARVVIVRIVLWWSLFTAATGGVKGLTRLFVTAPGPEHWVIGLVVIRFLFGAGEAGAYPNIARALGRWFPLRERATAQSFIWLSSRVGGAIAPALIGGLMLVGGGWQPAFWILGLAGGIWALWFWVFFRDSPEGHPRVNSAEREWIHGEAGTPTMERELGPRTRAAKSRGREREREGGREGERGRGGERERGGERGRGRGRGRERERGRGRGREDGQVHGALQPGGGEGSCGGQGELPAHFRWASLFSGNALALCLVSFCVSFCFYFYITFLPKYLKDQFQVDYGQSQLLSGLPLLVGGFACLVGGAVSDWAIRRTGSHRWGRSLVPIVGWSIAGVCALLVSQLDSAPAVMLLIVVAFACQDLGVPSMWSLPADIGGRHVGTLAGWMNSAGAVGGMLSPLVAAQVSIRYGWSAAFVMFGAVYLLGALAWCAVDAGRPLRTSAAN